MLFSGTVTQSWRWNALNATASAAWHAVLHATCYIIPYVMSGDIRHAIWDSMCYFVNEICRATIYMVQVQMRAQKQQHHIPGMLLHEILHDVSCMAGDICFVWRSCFCPNLYIPGRSGMRYAVCCTGSYVSCVQYQFFLVLYRVCFFRACANVASTASLVWLSSSRPWNLPDTLAATAVAHSTPQPRENETNLKRKGKRRTEEKKEKRKKLNKWKKEGRKWGKIKRD